jgi:hypothetical protein
MKILGKAKNIYGTIIEPRSASLVVYSLAHSVAVEPQRCSRSLCAEGSALAKLKRELDHPGLVRSHAYLHADRDRRASNQVQQQNGTQFCKTSGDRGSAKQMR